MKTPLQLIGWNLGVLWALLSQSSNLQAGTLYVDYSMQPSPERLLAHDLSILSTEAKFDIARLHGAGNRAVAYISIGEVAKDAPHRDTVTRLGIRTLGKNKSWDSTIVDLTDLRWQEFILDSLAKQAVARGFDGFFLDTVDTMEILAQREPERAADFRDALVRIIGELKTRYPDKMIIVNRGFAVFDKIKSHLSGVLIESLFQTYDFSKKTYTAVSPENVKWTLERAHRIKKENLPVYVVDYVDPRDSKLAVETGRKIRQEGFTPFITTPDLQGVVLAPLRLKKRRTLVLYGNQDGPMDERILYPFDSFTARYVQTPLEYIGFETTYHKITEPLPAISDDIRGILLDRSLHIPSSHESVVLEWLNEQKNRGCKIVFIGEIPFENEEVLQRFTKYFGLRGTSQHPQFEKKPVTDFADAAVIGFETQPVPQTGGFLDLQAPENSKIHLRLKGFSKSGTPVTFEPVFTTSWGGMAQSPYNSFVRADLVNLWIINPFTFLAEALDAHSFPVPDPTTRDGCRIFYSHIDGDGFSDYSTVKDGETSAEIIRDRILKRYPLPITVSVIEAEVRGVMQIQPRAISRKLVRIARSIFALPNVQAASHAYSHPFVWIKDDPDLLNYDSVRVPLKEKYQGNSPEQQLDYQREIAGSIQYIEEKLLPPGRKVELFLWSGNCKPPTEALRIVRELGIQNMNGGDTIITPLRSSISCVAPRTMEWADELQVFASNQNENVYTNDWNGPLFGTFRQVIETFKMTETPRRLKPVNIYYHFYSADRPDAFRSLELAYDWALGENLHAITAAEYARIARDSRNTAIFEMEDGGWRLINEGSLRTFRFPLQMGYPDLARSIGVTGYKVESDQIYVHTSGTGKATLYLSPSPAAQLYLVSSTIAGKGSRPASDSLVYAFADYRAGKIVLGGIPNGRTLRIQCGDQVSENTPRTDGTVEISVPAQGELRCSVL